MADWRPFSVAGRRAIVTGAAMGIGFAIARRFVEGGADVLLVNLDEAALRAAAERLAGAQGKVETLALDVGQVFALVQLASLVDGVVAVHHDQLT